MAFAHVDGFGDQDRGRDFAGVAAAFSSLLRRRGSVEARKRTVRTESHLRADNIHTNRQSLGNVLRGTNHVHNKDVGGVELLNCPFRGDADGADKDLGFAGDDDVDEGGELAACVVFVLCERSK